MLSAAALMIGSIAMAQVATPQVAQNQTDFDGHSNAAEVVQGSEYAADYQKARVRQVGKRNSAVIGQEGNALTVDEGNSADIYQLGSDAQAEIAQAGKANLASIAQVGGATGSDDFEGNKAVIAQGQNDAASNGNIGVITQGQAGVDDVFFGAEENEATLTQDGSFNAASITQLFDRNDATVTQNGTSNIATVLQNAADDLSDGMEAVVSQTGDENVSVVDQAPNESIAGSDSGRSSATTTQVGDFNRALQIQRSTALEGDLGETAVINQGVNAASTRAEAIQDQSGAGNYAEINQDGGDVPAADPGDYAKQRQTGWNNTALASQDTNGADSYSEANFSFQDQAGENNLSDHSQSGGENWAQSKQMGNNNVVDTDQDGNFNRAHVTQMWSNSVATTSQVGEANFAFVNQMEGQSSYISQNGTHNKAAVFQANPGSYLPDNQTELIFGERYEIEVTPPTLEPVPHLTYSTSPYDN